MKIIYGRIKEKNIKNLLVFYKLPPKPYNIKKFTYI